MEAILRSRAAANTPTESLLSGGAIEEPILQVWKDPLAMRGERQPAYIARNPKGLETAEKVEPPTCTPVPGR